MKVLNLKYKRKDIFEIVALASFLCFPLIKHILAYISYIFNLKIHGDFLSIIILYFPILLLIKLEKKIPADFLVLITSIVIFYLTTRLLHPEYEFWYTRDYYGVWEYVLKPSNGIYIYLFFRLVKRADNAKKAMKISAYIMLIYYLYILIDAIKRGYWINTDFKGNIIKMDYDLTFGYNVLLFTLISLSEFLKNKKLVDILYFVLGIGLIFLGGSRGPLLGIMIYVFMKIITSINVLRNNKQFLKLFITLGSLLIISLLIYIYWDMFISFLIRTNPNSRTLNMLIDGNIITDNGRNRIWRAAIDMIKRNPFGYGMMGTRHVIYYFHDVGHPHQIFLEILVDFGVVIGGIIIMSLFYNIIKQFRNYNNSWHEVLLIFIARASHLLISGTFWHIYAFWGLIAIIKNSELENIKNLKKAN